MSNYRMSKGTTEHFTSLEEMRTAWGMKPVTKKTSDKKKLKEQQERFLSKHKCKACGTPYMVMLWLVKILNVKGLKSSAKIKTVMKWYHISIPSVL